jgi:hypothetical protein
MAENEHGHKEEVRTRSVTIKNIGRAPQVMIDKDGNQHLIGPGQESEVELPEKQVDRLRKLAERGGGSLVVDGVDPRDARRGTEQDRPEPPEEHDSRAALAKKEAEVMREGQEADKERADRDRGKTGAELAAETGVGAHVFGPVETVAAPPDAPPEKPARRR